MLLEPEQGKPKISQINAMYIERIYNNDLFQWVVPKIVAHTLLNVMLLIHGQWWLSLANVPMTVWLLYEFFTVPRGNMGVFDPTEIHNRGQLKKHMRDCMIYLGYYLIFFFIYLYWWVSRDSVNIETTQRSFLPALSRCSMIIALLRGDPVSRSDDNDFVEF